jgi:hypothetical protein
VEAFATLLTYFSGPRYPLDLRMKLIRVIRRPDQYRVETLDPLEEYAVLWKMLRRTLYKKPDPIISNLSLFLP